jgi:hypothetical protein
MRRSLLLLDHRLRDRRFVRFGFIRHQLVAALSRAAPAILTAVDAQSGLRQTKSIDWFVNSSLLYA